MGITINSNNYSCDMGYGGFKRLRELVANKTSPEFNKHYLKLYDAMFMHSEEKKLFFEAYDKKTIYLIDEKKVCEDIANFLYQSDMEGEIDEKQSKKIYELIKNEDDAIVFGYAGRDDCAKMKDIKLIFDDNSKVDWF